MTSTIAKVVRKKRIFAHKILCTMLKRKISEKIMSACMNEFGEYYFKMSLIDWNKVISKYLN